MDVNMSLIFGKKVVIVGRLCTSTVFRYKKDGRLTAILFPKFMLIHTC